MSNELNQEHFGLHFPCEFVIKVFGNATEDFEVNVLSIIRVHVKDLAEDAIRNRPSKDGKYLALTITITAESREQLDALYRDLSSSPFVLMVL